MDHNPSSHEISEKFPLLADTPGPEIEKYVVRRECTPHNAAIEIIHSVLRVVSLETVKRYIRPMHKRTAGGGRIETQRSKDQNKRNP